MNTFPLDKGRWNLGVRRVSKLHPNRQMSDVVIDGSRIVTYLDRKPALSTNACRLYAPGRVSEAFAPLGVSSWPVVFLAARNIARDHTVAPIQRLNINQQDLHHGRQEDSGTARGGESKHG